MISLNKFNRKIRKLPSPIQVPTTEWTPKVRIDPDHPRRLAEKLRKICNSKHHYDSMPAAVVQAKLTKQDVYKCWICGTFHITTRKD